MILYKLVTTTETRLAASISELADISNISSKILSASLKDPSKLPPEVVSLTSEQTTLEEVIQKYSKPVKDKVVDPFRPNPSSLRI